MGKRVPVLPDTWDADFETSGQRWGVSWKLLKIIASRESAFKEAIQPYKGDVLLASAIGFMQTLYDTVMAYNKATGAALTHPTFKALKAEPKTLPPAKPNHSALAETASVAGPAASIDVGAWLLSTIVKRLMANGLPPVWSDPKYVSVLLLSYGGGSELVPKIVGAMLKSGIARENITLANVIDCASHTYPNRVEYNTGGGYLSDPQLALHIAREINDYQAIGGLGDTTERDYVSAPMMRPSVLPRADYPQDNQVATNDEDEEQHTTWGGWAAAAAIAAALAMAFA